MLYLILIAIGIGVGVVSALLGIGGGVLLVPLLPAFTDWSSHQVVAVALFIILGNSLGNLYWYNKQGLVRWDVLMYWGPFAAIGSFLGSYAALKVEGKVLLIALLAVVLAMILKICLDYFKNPRSKKLFTTSDWSPFKGVFGLFVGTLSGFCGVGTGLLSNLFFMSRRWLRKDEVAPTGNGVMVFVSFSSVVTFLVLGKAKSIDAAFFISEASSLALLMVTVFVSSFFCRPFNPYISDNLRFSALLLTLLSVFIYVLSGLVN